MDKIAQRLSEWFGSTPFILIHVLWFGAWFPLGGSTDGLTVIVSLEAIFLSLFILRAENISERHMEAYIKETKRVSHEDLKVSKEIKNKLAKH